MLLAVCKIVRILKQSQDILNGCSVINVFKIHLQWITGANDDSNSKFRLEQNSVQDKQWQSLYYYVVDVKNVIHWHHAYLTIHE